MRPWPWAVLELDRVCAASNLLCCSCDLKVWYGSALRVALAKLISYLYIDVCRSEDEGKNKKNLARDLKKIKIYFLYHSPSRREFLWRGFSCRHVRNLLSDCRRPKKAETSHGSCWQWLLVVDGI
ncbi:hypothetical protein VPH35_073025 [Triticum aestivum]